MQRKLKPGDFYTKIITPCYTELGEQITFKKVPFKVQETISLDRNYIASLDVYDVNKYNEKELLLRCRDFIKKHDFLKF